MLDRAGLAIIRYDTPDIQVIRRGSHVLCAVTGRPIALEDLRYWSVARQEAYVGPAELIEAAKRG
ncbi:hypothetical protein GGR88_001690 [Sphingomonas jejuensis]|uniref:DUF2093 domain-containing protein n=1 Tax=Sphingomonas jejuensis TaxID=904715 RepID=A0ABX0XNB6_9SPHN|nr:DUF2093 domain-containing protein [Sphingomonas jejuensis]NJC34216.1 hypothetical protein [Sphingomonas jejuensis]